MKKSNKVLFLASFEDASILRKFTILFIITSIVPVGLLYYFYIQTTQLGHMTISAHKLYLRYAPYGFRRIYRFYHHPFPAC